MGIVNLLRRYRSQLFPLLTYFLSPSDPSSGIWASVEERKGRRGSWYRPDFRDNQQMVHSVHCSGLHIRLCGLDWRHEVEDLCTAGEFKFRVLDIAD